YLGTEPGDADDGFNLVSAIQLDRISDPGLEDRQAVVMDVVPAPITMTHMAIQNGFKIVVDPAIVLDDQHAVVLHHPECGEEGIEKPSPAHAASLSGRDSSVDLSRSTGMTVLTTPSAITNTTSPSDQYFCPVDIASLKASENMTRFSFCTSIRCFRSS